MAKLEVYEYLRCPMGVSTLYLITEGIYKRSRSERRLDDDERSEEEEEKRGVWPTHHLNMYPHITLMCLYMG